jgi:hypothetical protein
MIEGDKNGFCLVSGRDLHLPIFLIAFYSPLLHPQECIITITASLFTTLSTTLLLPFTHIYGAYVSSVL